jgi:hypothetical protein
MKILLPFLILASLAFAEIVEFEFTSGGHSFKAEGLSNMKYPWSTVENENFLMVTHASTYWDKEKETWKGIDSLVQFFKEKNYPYKYLATVHELAMEKARPDEVTFPPGLTRSDVHPFQGDSHRIVLKGKNIVSAGGNFTICACNATRSALALSQTKGEINVFFPLDAVYEGEKGKFRTLAEISARYQDKDFITYLGEEFFHVDTLPCKQPTLYALDRTFRYKIYRSGKFIGTYGAGKTPVKMHFDSSENVIRSLLGK